MRRSPRGGTRGGRAAAAGLLLCPALGELLDAEPLVVVALGGEELLEVGLAVEAALERGEVAQLEAPVAVAASEALGVVDLVVGHQLLGEVNHSAAHAAVVGLARTPPPLGPVRRWPAGR